MFNYHIITYREHVLVLANAELCLLGTSFSFPIVLVYPNQKRHNRAMQLLQQGTSGLSTRRRELVGIVLGPYSFDSLQPDSY